MGYWVSGYRLSISLHRGGRDCGGRELGVRHAEARLAYPPSPLEEAWAPCRQAQRGVGPRTWRRLGSRWCKCSARSTGHCTKCLATCSTTSRRRRARAARRARRPMRCICPSAQRSPPGRLLQRSRRRTDAVRSCEHCGCARRRRRRVAGRGGACGSEPHAQYYQQREQPARRTAPHHSPPHHHCFMATQRRAPTTAQRPPCLRRAACSDNHCRPRRRTRTPEPWCAPRVATPPAPPPPRPERALAAGPCCSSRSVAAGQRRVLGA